MFWAHFYRWGIRGSEVRSLCRSLGQVAEPWSDMNEITPLSFYKIHKGAGTRPTAIITSNRNETSRNLQVPEDGCSLLENAWWVSGLRVYVSSTSVTGDACCLIVETQKISVRRTEDLVFSSWGHSLDCPSLQPDLGWTHVASPPLPLHLFVCFSIHSVNIALSHW